MPEDDAPLTVGDLRRALEGVPDDLPLRLAPDDTGSNYLVAVTAEHHRLTIESLDHDGTYQGADHLRIQVRPATPEETRVVYRPATGGGESP